MYPALTFTQTNFFNCEQDKDGDVEMAKADEPEGEAAEEANGKKRKVYHPAYSIALAGSLTSFLTASCLQGCYL